MMAEMKTIYAMIKEMVDKGYLGDNLLSTDAQQEGSYFQAGKSSIQYNGSWGASGIRVPDCELYKKQKNRCNPFPMSRKNMQS